MKQIIISLLLSLPIITNAQFPMRDTIKGKCIYYLPPEFSKELTPRLDTSTWITRKATQTVCSKLRLIDCGFVHGHKCEPYWEEQSLLIGVRTNFKDDRYWISIAIEWELPIKYKLLFIPD